MSPDRTLRLRPIATLSRAGHRQAQEDAKVFPQSPVFGETGIKGQASHLRNCKKNYQSAIFYVPFSCKIAGCARAESGAK
jgi:hypothetical protein